MVAAISQALDTLLTGMTAVLGTHRMDEFLNQCGEESK
jgi:hypothetical protein